MRVNRFLTLLVAAAGFAAVGCSGPARTSVSGKVTVEGKPPGVSGAIISFIGSDNQTVTAEVGADGAYQASGVLVGENKICLNYNGTKRGNPTMVEDPDPERTRINKKKYEEDMAKAAKDAAANPVPTKYNDPGSSGLKFVAEAGGNNTYNVDMKK